MTIGKSRNIWSPVSNKQMATNTDPAMCHERTPFADQTKSPPEEDRRAHPTRQPRGRNTPSPEIKVGSEHTPCQRRTTARPHTIANRKEPHTNRDVNMIPDRGKELNEPAAMRIEHGEPSPEFNNFVCASNSRFC